MATALSWEAAEGSLPIEIAALFGPDTELLLAIPEHKVALPGGPRGTQCDVYALIKSSGQTMSLAVEAKVNEPFGPTVGEWMQNPSPGKRERLEFICGLLGLEYPIPKHLRYQLLHRTAAAVIEANRFKTDKAAMVVQSFSQEHRWFEDFALFCDIMGKKAAARQAIQVALPSGLDLTLGWAVGSPSFL